MDVNATIAAFLRSEELPDSYHKTIEQIYQPLAQSAVERFHRLHRSCVIGLCGPQGSGKSTGAAVMQILIQAQGLRAAVLSLDDLYLTHAERQRLAQTVQPLLATRGVPGTHDVQLGKNVIDHLLHAHHTALPSFNKATDDRRPQSEWKIFDGPADIVLFEGWCVGAHPQPSSALVEPINQLERERDPYGIWRTYVNNALVKYQALFLQIDFLILLEPPNFEIVARWRREQEDKLREKSAGETHLKIMTDTEIDEFIQHFERITRWIIKEMPSRADEVVNLDRNRRLIGSLNFRR